jgi:regulator of sigma E protease
MLESVPLPVVCLLAYLILVTPLVVFHELGHFVVARLCGVKVDRFSIGFGRALLSWRSRSGMEWRLGWLPLGGYVKFAGDPNSASGVPDVEDLAELKREIIAAEGPGAEKRYFHFKPVWQRALIAVAGPATNFILAIAIFALIYSVIGRPMATPRVERVFSGSPAAAAGLAPGDLILSVAGAKIDSPDQVVQEIALRSGTPTPILVERGGRRLALTVTPVRSLNEDPRVRMRVGRIGLLVGVVPGPHPLVRDRPDQAVVRGINTSWRLVRYTSTYIGRIFVGQESGSAIGGPIRTAAMSGQLVKDAAHATPGKPALQVLNIGFTLLQMAAIVSVSLGFLNLLPIPVLDGGHLLFYAYEAVARKPLGVRVQEAGFRIGLALLAGLMLFATWNDLHPMMLSVFKNLGGLFS